MHVVRLLAVERFAQLEGGAECLVRLLQRSAAVVQSPDLVEANPLAAPGVKPKSGCVPFVRPSG